MRHNIIKVFISSTFQEMIKERDDIQQIAFSKLRFWGKQLGVMIVAIDLRWGITEEDIATGKLAELCADAIEICAPYFVAILGNAYGTDDPKVLGCVGDKYKGKSVTEYEITKGILERQNSRALIYNITYSSYKEKFFKKRKLERLKKNLKENNQVIDVNVEERLIKTMISDIQELVMREIVSEPNLTTVQKSNYSVRNSYFSQYYNAYYSGEYIKPFKDIFESRQYVAVSSSEQDLISMFMYNLAFGMEGRNVLYHDFKMPEYTKDKSGFIRHIFEFINDGRDSFVQLSSLTEDDICQQLSLCGNIDIYIDSLGVLDSASADAIVNYILSLSHFANVRFVISHYDGMDYFADEIEVFDVPEFTKGEAEKFVISYLNEYKKNSNECLTRSIVSHILKQNNSGALFLQLLMNEILMRGCPSELILEEIDRFENVKTICGLSEKILLRMIEVFEQRPEQEGLIRSICMAICLPEDYLSYEELHLYMKAAGYCRTDVDDALQYVGDHLIVCDNSYKFRHKEMKNVVERIFSEELAQFDRDIYFSNLSEMQCSAHTVYESCRYYLRHEDTEGFIEYISLPVHFCYMYYDRMGKLLEMLRECKTDFMSHLKEVLSVDAKSRAFWDNEKYHLGVLGVLEYLGEYNFILEIIKKREAAATITPKLRYRLAGIYRDKADYAQALSILEKMIAETIDDPELEIAIYDCCAYCQGKIGRLEESRANANQAIRLRKYNPKLFEPDMPVSYNSKAFSYYASGDYKNAIDLYEKSINIRIKYLGAKHPRVANNINNIAKSYLRMGEVETARELFEKALKILKDTVGEYHVYYLTTLVNVIKCDLVQNTDGINLEQMIFKLTEVKAVFLEKMSVSDYTYNVDVMIGTCWRLMGELEKAEEFLEPAYKYFLSSRGVDSFECKEIRSIRA